MYREYRIVENIASSVSQYELYRDQVYRYTPRECSLISSMRLVTLGPSQYKDVILPV